jgi:hypothetical protein
VFVEPKLAGDVALQILKGPPDQAALKTQKGGGVGAGLDNDEIRFAKQ